MDDKYLVSICIPTYNRAHILDKTLCKIVGNKAFCDEVEIIISDNCSIDNTKEVAKKYTDTYDNIKYYCNKENVRDANFWLAIERATGDYIKLQGDQYAFTNEGLEMMLDIVRRSQSEKMGLFFTNDFIYAKKNVKTVTCPDVNTFLNYVSTYMTSINIFGIWKSDRKLIQDPFQEVSKKIPQVDWCLQLLQKKKKSIIINEKIYELSHDGTIPRELKYDWFEIHVKNYYDIVYKHLESKGNKGGISDAALYEDKINCLKHFRSEFFRTFVFPPREYTYNKKNTIKVMNQYCGEVSLYKKYKRLLPLSYLAYPYFVFRYTDNTAKKLVKTLLRYNGHN